MPTAITIERLRKEFAAGAAPTVAVDDVSLSIEPGELFFLLGPSGCGKTTLLRMIAGFIEPTAGLLLFDDRDVTRLPPNRRNTGMVFQSYALWPHMTVEENVAFGLGLRRLPAPERARRTAEALDQVQMGFYAKRKPNQLSGGQQQRIALARALVIRPDVLLLDEPLSNLDAKLRLDLRAEIRRICKQAGITTVYVTHDQKEALSMADRLAILDRGGIAQLGAPHDLYRRPATRFVAEFLGESNFLSGTAAGHSIETAAGPLTSSIPSSGPVTVSIRPEALRFGPGPNNLRGTLQGTTFLGDLAQHTLLLSGGGAVRLSTLNPPGSGGPAVGSPVVLSVDPADVIPLPPGP